MVKVVYVGKKQTAFDNVARSGKVWNGAGDVQEVTESQAKELIKYPDQWELADLRDVARVEKPTNITVTDEIGDTVVIDPEALKRPLETMSKNELRAYAKDKWGKDLDGRKSTKQMIDQIEEWEHELNVTAGPRAE